MNQNNFRFFLSCPSGIEELLLEELNQLNIEESKISKGGVYFNSDDSKATEVIACSRLGSRLYLKFHEFRVFNDNSIYKKAVNYDWTQIFDVDSSFKINTKLTPSKNGKRKSKFRNNIFLSQVLKDGLCDSFRRAVDRRPNVSKDDADISIMMHVRPSDDFKTKMEEVDLFLDLSGIALSNRGYRSENFPAPLRENLAAAIVYSMGDLSNCNSYLDLMCGSATSMIEFAYIKGNIAASFRHLENYFENDRSLPWSWDKSKIFKPDFDLLKEIYESSSKKLESLKNEIKLYGVDIKSDHINIARYHLENAGLEGCFTLKKEDATKAQIEIENGIVFTNPPYGKRLEDSKLEDLYYFLGENCKNHYKNNTWFLFTGNIPLIKKVSLRTSSKKKFFNGDIECRLAKYDLF